MEYLNHIALYTYNSNSILPIYAVNVFGGGSNCGGGGFSLNWVKDKSSYSKVSIPDSTLEKTSTGMSSNRRVANVAAGRTAIGTL